MIKEAIEKLMQAENLTYDQVKESVDEIMTGQASPALIASFLTALSIKGETDEEIAGAAESMRSKALPLESDGDILDIVGTGGDKSGSFNISTTAGIIAAAAGVRIAKHGNRAAPLRAALPTVWRRWGSTSTPAKRRWSAPCGRRTSASCSPKSTTAP